MISEEIPESIARLRTSCAVTPRTPDHWIADLRMGDPAVLEEFARIAAQAARRSSRRRAAWGWDGFSDEEIEDIVAECRLRIIQRVADEQFVIRERFFETYISAVVSNYAVDLIRDLARLPSQPIDDRQPQPDEHADQPAPGSDRAPLYAALDGCLRRLNLRYQQIVEWYSKGMPRSWIAANLDPPMKPDTLSVRWNEIRRSLRLCLAEAGYRM